MTRIQQYSDNGAIVMILLNETIFDLMHITSEQFSFSLPVRNIFYDNIYYRNQQCSKLLKLIHLLKIIQLWIEFQG